MSYSLDTKVMKNAKGETFLAINFQLDKKLKRLLMLDMGLVGTVHLAVYYGMFNCTLSSTLLVIGLSLLFSGVMMLLNYQNIHYYLKMTILYGMVREAFESDEEDQDAVRQKLIRQSMSDCIEEYKWVSLRTILVILAEMGVVAAASLVNLVFMAALLLTIWKVLILSAIGKKREIQKQQLHALKMNNNKE